MMLLNFYACSIVILQDLFREHEYTWQTQETVLMCYFIFELIMRVIFQTPPKYRILLKISFYIDLAIISPIFLLIVFNLEDTRQLGFIRILRIFKVFRIVRLIDFLRKLNPKRDSLEINYKTPTISPLIKQILMMIVSLFSALFIGAGIIAYIDEVCEDTAFTFNINYIDALYYMAITGSTVGYGDIYPTIVTSRIAVICTIVVIIYIFGTQITKIVTLMKSWDSYDVKIKQEDHIVIFLFNDNIEILTSFLLCYLRYENLPGLEYKKKGAIYKRNILLISNRDKGIDPKIKEFIQLSIFENRIVYISSKGSVDKRLIDRGYLNKAKAIYFLCDPTEDFCSNQDKLSIIYSHFLRNNSINADIYIQSNVECSDYRNQDTDRETSRNFTFKSTISNRLFNDSTCK